MTDFDATCSANKPSRMYAFKMELNALLYKARIRIGRKLFQWSMKLQCADGNLIKHAKMEFSVFGISSDSPNGPNRWMYECMMELLQVFSTQGHSGSSAPYAISQFSKLANFEPISPITGKDEEWAEPHHESICQNKRYGSLFKDLKTGEVRNIESIIFEDENGSAYTGPGSDLVPIRFPYNVPKARPFIRKFFVDYDELTGTYFLELKDTDEEITEKLKACYDYLTDEDCANIIQKLKAYIEEDRVRTQEHREKRRAEKEASDKLKGATSMVEDRRDDVGS